jgi:CyaY protein
MLTWAELQESPVPGRIEASQAQPVHPMNDSEFIQLAETALSYIQQGLEGADLDFEQPADGILEIEFDDGSKIVINRHNAAREIWVAARSGGFHFRHDGSTWRDTRDGTEMFAKLVSLIAAQGGVTASFG